LSVSVAALDLTFVSVSVSALNPNSVSVSVAALTLTSVSVSVSALNLASASAESPGADSLTNACSSRVTYWDLHIRESEGSCPKPNLSLKSHV